VDKRSGLSSRSEMKADEGRAQTTRLVSFSAQDRIAMTGLRALGGADFHAPERGRSNYAIGQRRS